MLEVLAPAGSLECALAAIQNGTDAIYLGLNAFSARHSAENFDETAFRTVLRRAHFCGVKVYVAMNTVVKDGELDAFLQNLLFVWNEGADAIILQDPLLGKYVHKQYPDIVLHLSTQAGVCNVEGAKFAKECGFSRVILARETPLREIREIANFMETEVFVQGALCTCFSGQCYFSSFAGGNSGNRGRCKQPCRKLYAYDRKGNTEKNYALSLSDLCVGEDIEKLIDAGVVSFKIEGRMRRAEYVAAAVRYYRVLLDKKGSAELALSDLKRTYNRGNYTKGLAFGQDKRFLSTAIQCHLGEKVGVVKVVNGKYYVESRFQPTQGDAFKILRDGKELCGAIFSKREGRTFTIQSKVRLKNGDSVFVTTDTATATRVLSAEKLGALSIELSFVEGERAFMRCGNITVYGETPLQTAQNRALTKEELQDCFLKTDGLPVAVEFASLVVEGNIFIPKSSLNGLRRTFYTEIADRIAKGENTQYCLKPIEIQQNRLQSNTKTAVISNDFTAIVPDIAIYKADDYRASLPQSFTQGSFEKYLYYPAFATDTDLSALRTRLQECAIDGIYAENYGGLIFAKENGLKVFVGTGFNLLNSLSISELLKIENVSYYALSKEGHLEELKPLSSEKAFVLSSGDIKIMDLCYCPFGKTCSVCDKKAVYTLTDENGREFPVRRYVAGDGSCRFEVYNCATLVGKGMETCGQLLDLTLQADKLAPYQAKDDEIKQKGVYSAYTSGHYKRGVL